MTVTDTRRRCCKVELCPAYVVAGSKHCSAHRTAKKLSQVQKGHRCDKCNRELHPGDYVTLQSTATRIVCAVCPRKERRQSPRRKVETPLFDDDAEGANA